MNRRVVDWPAAGLILLAGVWIFRSSPTAPKPLRVAIIVLLVASVFYQSFVLRFARRAITDRRRFYKELWGRGDAEQAPRFNKPEEEMIILLGRIKGDRFLAVISLLAVLLALYLERDHFAIVMTLGRWFVAVRLDLDVRSLRRQIPPDLVRAPAPVPVPPGATLAEVDVDLARVHDFIEPSHALPFWTLANAEEWLGSVGFARRGDLWYASLASLRALDPGEIRAIRFIER
jgi:hypothetical protein